MALLTQQVVNQLEALMEEVDELLKKTFQNVHQGFPRETFTRFLKTREGNAQKAQKMLVDCLEWRVQNDIDDMLAKPIVPGELYRGIRDSQLVGLSGYSNEGLPVFAVGVGLSTFDRASISIVHYYVQSHIQINEYRDRVILPAATKTLNQIKLLTTISSIDDLNYPEKTQTYYIVNAPYVFSACWKVVKPLLQERTRNKIDVLSSCGEDDLLKIMDYSSLPHFCRKRSSDSVKYSESSSGNCFSLDHPFHQQLYSYVKQQFLLCQPAQPVKQGSVHVTLPEDADKEVIAETLESELKKFKDLNISQGSNVNSYKF
ncbi:phosphatidylinositol/phosphatidylcholine transfer protein SFH2-like [Salvia divinorum]|uniref:Phosphatidylinositol/phosphatidylcholine transfer protein SFH2-like n=1 Tax=Salvia divinorum TaxID=28513 RepID=A0ABD1I6C6_SALDI